MISGIAYRLRIHLSPAFEGAAQGELIGKLQAGPGGQSMGYAREFQAWTGEPFAEVKSRCVALNVSPERNDNFFNRLGFEAFFKLCDAQIFGFDAVERRNFSAEDVIFSAKGTGFLDAQNINGLLNDAHQGRVSARVAANITGRCLSQRATSCAELDSLARANHRLGQLFCIRVFRLDQMQGDTLRRARPDAGQTVQRGDEGRDWFRERHFSFSFILLVLVPAIESEDDDEDEKHIALSQSPAG